METSIGNVSSDRAFTETCIEFLLLPENRAFTTLNLTLGGCELGSGPRDQLFYKSDYFV